jgi:hypothetical protein
MGTIRNFNKINFRLFSLRVGNLEIRNFYNDNGKIKSLSGKKTSNFSHYEIIKLEPNSYFGKESEYELNGEFYYDPNNTSVKIHKSCFNSLERCYVLAYWIDINHDEKIPDLKFVGGRPFDLTKEELVDFMSLAKCGQQEIEKILKDFNDED